MKKCKQCEFKPGDLVELRWLVHSPKAFGDESSKYAYRLEASQLGTVVGVWRSGGGFEGVRPYYLKVWIDGCVYIIEHYYLNMVCSERAVECAV